MDKTVESRYWITSEGGYRIGHYHLSLTDALAWLGEIEYPAPLHIEREVSEEISAPIAHKAARSSATAAPIDLALYWLEGVTHPDPNLNRRLMRARGALKGDPDVYADKGGYGATGRWHNHTDPDIHENCPGCSAVDATAARSTKFDVCICGHSVGDHALGVGFEGCGVCDCVSYARDASPTDVVAERWTTEKSQRIAEGLVAELREGHHRLTMVCVPEGKLADRIEFMVEQSGEDSEALIGWAKLSREGYELVRLHNRGTSGPYGRRTQRFLDAYEAAHPYEPSEPEKTDAHGRGWSPTEAPAADWEAIASLLMLSHHHTRHISEGDCPRCEGEERFAKATAAPTVTEHAGPARGTTDDAVSPVRVDDRSSVPAPASDYPGEDTPTDDCGCKPVFWNPYNGVTQCHRCGRTVEGAPGSAGAEPQTRLDRIRDLLAPNKVLNSKVVLPSPTVPELDGVWVAVPLDRHLKIIETIDCTCDPPGPDMHAEGCALVRSGIAARPSQGDISNG